MSFPGHCWRGLLVLAGLHPDLTNALSQPWSRRGEVEEASPFPLPQLCLALQFPTQTDSPAQTSSHWEFTPATS